MDLVLIWLYGLKVVILIISTHFNSLELKYELWLKLKSSQKNQIIRSLALKPKWN